MKTCIISAILVICCAASVLSQGYRDIEAITCPTSDGNINVTRTELILRGYRFACDSVDAGYVVYLSDHKANVRAELSRTDIGLELTVFENDLVMRVQALRNDMIAFRSGSSNVSYRSESVGFDLIRYCLALSQDGRSS